MNRKKRKEKDRPSVLALFLPVFLIFILAVSVIGFIEKGRMFYQHYRLEKSKEENTAFENSIDSDIVELEDSEQDIEYVTPEDNVDIVL